MFTWKPIYRELATALINYRNRQDELIAMIKAMRDQNLPVISLKDKASGGKEIELSAIDPFTFFANFNRGITDESRRKMLAYLKEKLGLVAPIPQDFHAIPVAMLIKSWFFPYSQDGVEGDIPALWDLASACLRCSPNTLEPKFFDRCLKIKQVGVAKLTMGLFWFNPDDYPALDAVMSEYLKTKGIELDIRKIVSHENYIAVVNAVQEKMGKDYSQLSRDAYLESNRVPAIPAELDAGLQSLLNAEAEFNKVSVEQVVAYLAGGSESESKDDEVSNRLEIMPLIAAVLKRAPHDLENLRKTCAKLWVLANGQDTIRRKNFLDSNAASSVIAALLDESSDLDEMERIDQFIVQAVENGYTDKDESDVSGAAQFASVLMSVQYPDRYVDFRENRWNRLFKLVMSNDSRLCSGSSHARKIARAGKFAAALSSTPTFKKYFGNEHGTWKVAAFAWWFRNGLFKMRKVPAMKQYWAGGFLWGGQSGKGESHLEEFVFENLWKTGFARDGTEKKHKEHWELFEKIKPGDEFAIKGYGGRNDLNIHYVGDVESVDAVEGVIHLKKLDRLLFRGKAPFAGKGGNWFGTLVAVTDPDAIRAVFHGEVAAQPFPNVNRVLNTILYGPPGTGKTFQAIHKAVLLIDGSLLDGGDKAVQTRFRQLKDEGRIEVVTFHQSFGYEEFVEGIRPTVDATGEEDRPAFDYRDGIFKRLAHRALADAWAPTPVKAAVEGFEARWRRLIQTISDDPDQEYEGLTVKTKYRLEITTRGNIRGYNTHNPQAAILSCSPANLRKVFLRFYNQKAVTTGEINEAVGVGNHASLIAVVFRELQRIEKVSDSAAALPAYEDLKAANLEALEHSDTLPERLKTQAVTPRYVLIVDEINRGNISRILGELITLVEPDKRIGADHQLIVTLPYTNEPFGVPPNLFIVGTMNTADKSIALVDVALRRRFEFEECMPEFGAAVCPGLTEQMKDMLEEMNLRITLRKDREHQIGHSYFVSIDDESAFEMVFRRSILPLLQEYFYNDWDGLRFVLGETKDQNGRFIISLPNREPNRARNHWQWNPLVWKGEVNFLAELMANYGMKQETASNA